MVNSERELRSQSKTAAVAVHVQLFFVRYLLFHRMNGEQSDDDHIVLCRLTFYGKCASSRWLSLRDSRISLFSFFWGQDWIISTSSRQQNVGLWPQERKKKQEIRKVRDNRQWRPLRGDGFISPLDPPSGCHLPIFPVTHNVWIWA